MKTLREKFAASAQVWLSRLHQHRYETENLTIDLTALPDSELLCRSIVSDAFLDFAPYMFNVFAPKEYPRLRRTIAYLARLQHLQQGAIGRDKERRDTHTAALNALIKSFHLLSPEQRAQRTKEVFGWEQ